MIAQYLAIDFPELVERLVLAVSLAKQNETVQNVVGSWVKMAEAGDYQRLFSDTAEKSYTEAYIRKNHLRQLYPILGRIGRPASFSRFLVQANACLTHNAFEELEKIRCPTLVIGGSDDKIVGPEAAAELAHQIPASRLILCRGLGHAAYEESKTSDRDVLDFFVK